jgi:micrococcal nuclease
VRVVEVVDGDTIVVALPDGTTDIVRLLGVDTPKCD